MYADKKRRFLQFLIIEQQVNIYPREKYVQQLLSLRQNGLVKIITGLRRVGKSYLLFSLFSQRLLQEGVSEDHIIGISLDSYANKHLRKAELFYRFVQDKIQFSTERYYVLIDEVQLLEDFVDVLNGLLHIPNVDVYVTGSNARFLSSDVVTEFRGRGTQVHLYPLSFKEIYEYSKSDVLSLWRDYMCYGGLPLVVLADSVQQKAQILRNLMKETYLSDIVSRNQVKNDSDLEELLVLLASNIGALTNPNKLANTFKSEKKSDISHNTIKLYIDYFIDSFLISRATRYDIKGHKYINSPYKYYFSDMGLRNALIGFRQVEPTHAMENILYNHFLEQGYIVDVGNVSVIGKNAEGNSQRSTYEIDFVCNRGNERLYIQSAYTLGDEQKLQQEQRPLLLTKDNFRKMILTTDNVPNHALDNGIQIMNIYEYLLS